MKKVEFLEMEYAPADFAGNIDFHDVSLIHNQLYDEFLISFFNRSLEDLLFEKNYD